MKTACIAFVAALLLSPLTAFAQDDELPPPPTGQDQPTENPQTPPPPAPTPEAATAPPAAAAVTPPPTEAVAAAPGPLLLVGLGAGVYIPTSKLGVNFLVGIDAAYQLPWLGRKLGVGLGLGYSQPTTSGQISDVRFGGEYNGVASYSSTMRELLLDLRASYRFFSWDSRWSPQVGIGPAFYFLSHKVEAATVEQTETSTQVGFLLTLGADFRLGPGALTGEVRIPFATVGQRTTGDSNVGAVSVLVGYRFRI